MDARLRALGWRVAAGVPWPVWRPLVALGAHLASCHRVGARAQWCANFEAVTGCRATRADLAAGLRSWGRNTIQSLQLGRWSSGRIARSVLISPGDRERLLRLANETGAVIGLPHCGSWDLAGAWACLHAMPVSTVAEELGQAEFAYFRQQRERLGFRVYGHRDPRALARLTDDLGQGRLVCLLADRDFSRRGLPVTWHLDGGDFAATMPPGPAQLALRTGASLLGVACHFEGASMRMVVSEPLTPGLAPTSQREKITVMTQRLCDFFATQVRAHPHDWHMLQPVLPGVGESVVTR